MSEPGGSEDSPVPLVAGDLAEREKVVAAGESETVEFKKATGQLTRTGETLSAFLSPAAVSSNIA